MSSQSRLRRRVDEWNDHCEVGVEVDYRKDDGRIVRTRTRSAATILSGHTAVVWLDGVSGCVALDRVTRRDQK